MKEVGYPSLRPVNCSKLGQNMAFDAPSDVIFPGRAPAPPMCLSLLGGRDNILWHIQEGGFSFSATVLFVTFCDLFLPLAVSCRAVGMITSREFNREQKNQMQTTGHAQQRPV